MVHGAWCMVHGHGAWAWAWAWAWVHALTSSPASIARAARVTIAAPPPAGCHAALGAHLPPPPDAAAWVGCMSTGPHWDRVWWLWCTRVVAQGSEREGAHAQIDELTCARDDGKGEAKGW